jgi:arylsulfatase A-like enzyme
MEDYLACIVAVDENIGRVLDYLDVNKLDKNTIVVYTSDQGFYLGEHGWFDKRFMYEESFKSPLLIRYPKKIKKARVEDKFVMNLDFAPTFLDYAGVEIPEDIQGKSLKTIFEEKDEAWRESIYYHYYAYPAWHDVPKHDGIRNKQYKIIHYYDIGIWELFDLDNDPNELKNVYEETEYSKIRTDMTVKYYDMREELLVND